MKKHIYAVADDKEKVIIETFEFFNQNLRDLVVKLQHTNENISWYNTTHPECPDWVKGTNQVENFLDDLTRLLERYNVELTCQRTDDIDYNTNSTFEIIANFLTTDEPIEFNLGKRITG